MFKVQFFVEDKRLGEILQLISGKVGNLSQQPVANAEMVNGKAKQIHNAGSLQDAVIHELLRIPEVKRSMAFTKTQAASVIEALGGSAGSAQSMLGRLQNEHKKIRRLKRGFYKIIKT